MNRSEIFRVIIVSIISIACIGNDASSQDWPQINGPDRNGVAAGEEIIDWPSDGPKQIWSHPVGKGFSGPVIAGGQLIIFHRPKQEYLVECLNAETGKPIWSQNLKSEYQGGGPDGDDGPKSVPLIHDGKLYLLGTGGNLFCLSMSDGKTIWEKNVLKAYRSPSGYFGAGTSPIVIDDKLILNVGGKDAAVVAFELETGKEVWKSFDDRASYSSPIEAIINDKKTAVFITRLHLLGIDPENGTVDFETRFGKTGPTVNAAMPVFVDGNLFINAAYGVGARWIKFNGDQPESVWANDDSFSSHYSTPIFLDGHLYGTCGREDFGNGTFRCVESTTGNVKWEHPIPVGHTLQIGKKLLLLDSDGTLHAINPTPEKFFPIASKKIFDASRAMPAISNGRFFARSNAKNGRGELVCLQVGKTN